MNTQNRLPTIPIRARIAKTLSLLLGVAFLWAQAITAAADEVVMTASVVDGLYVNTTPRATFCARYNSTCNNSWTFDLPLTYAKMVDVGGPDLRSRVYAQVPAQRSITLVNQTTHETASMSLSVVHLGQRLSYQTNWVTGAMVSGCRSGAVHGQVGRYLDHLWTFSGSPCHAMNTGNGQLQDSQATRIGIGVTPSFPDASQLSSGVWEGRVNYSIGPSQDFDFGNTYELSTHTVAVRIRLTVVHEIDVQLPDAGSVIALKPEGGWDRAINSKRAPARLYHDSPLRLSAAGPLTVYLACQYPGRSSQCHMRNQFGNHQVPVGVTLTLPSTFTHNGQPVARLLLNEHRENRKPITPSGNLTQQPGTLHFDVQGDDVKQMLKYRGSEYSGWITIIFDASP